MVGSFYHWVDLEMLQNLTSHLSSSFFPFPSHLFSSLSSLLHSILSLFLSFLPSYLSSKWFSPIHTYTITNTWPFCGWTGPCVWPQCWRNNQLDIRERRLHLLRGLWPRPWDHPGPGSQTPRLWEGFGGSEGAGELDLVIANPSYLFCFDAYPLNALRRQPLKGFLNMLISINFVPPYAVHLTCLTVIHS